MALKQELSESLILELQVQTSWLGDKSSVSPTYWSYRYKCHGLETGAV